MLDAEPPEESFFDFTQDDIDAELGPMRRVIAQGTFDILHPGHVHYLSDAASLGDELHVIIARGENVTHKEPLSSRTTTPGHGRRAQPVDEAHLGHSDDIFIPIERIEPDIIDWATTSTTTTSNSKRRCPPGVSTVILSGQPLETEAADRVLSTGRIIDRILDERS